MRLTTPAVKPLVVSISSVTISCMGIDVPALSFGFPDHFWVAIAAELFSPGIQEKLGEALQYFWREHQSPLVQFCDVLFQVLFTKLSERLFGDFGSAGTTFWCSLAMIISRALLLMTRTAERTIVAECLASKRASFMEGHRDQRWLEIVVVAVMHFMLALNAAAIRAASTLVVKGTMT